MNQKTLKHIANSSEPLESGTVQDLIDLTKQFPYFAWPYAILARHYHKKQDFRTEALMHQAAMRIPDRTWLYHFTHDQSDEKVVKHVFEPIIEPIVENEIIAPQQNSTIELEENTEVIEQETVEVKESPFTKAAKLDAEDKIKNASSELKIRPQQMAYDLESLFSEENKIEQSTHKGPASNDFYSWLNGQNTRNESPSKANAQNEPPKIIEHQKSIIENFLITKPSISRPKQEFFKPEKAQKKGEQLTGAIVTETLARIYLKQENPQKAIWAYKQLQLKFPEKKTYFANLISQIEKEQNKS